MRWERADVTVRADVERVLRGADVVYYLVHSLGSADFEQRGPDCARPSWLRGRGAGVQQIVYLGGLAEEAPDLSPHLRSRAETAESSPHAASP